MDNAGELINTNEKSFLELVLHYISLLMRYKYMIIIGSAVAAVFIVIFSIITIKLPADRSPLPNIYRAYGIVLFQEGGSNTSMSAMLSAFGVESPSGGVSASQFALQILNSRPYLDNVVNHFQIISKLGIVENQKTRSRGIITNSSEYSFNQESGALTIAFTDVDPVFAAEVVNYEISLLETWFLEQSVSIRSNELSLMEEKIEELTTDIKTIEESIKAFQKEHGVLDIREIAMAQTTMLTDLRTSLNQVELDIRAYSEYSTIEDPALTTLKSQRNNIISQIRKIEDGYTSSDGRNMPSLADLPQLSLTFSHMQAELSLKNQLYLTLFERYEVTKLMAADAGAFSVLEYAEVPEEKIGPSRGKLCITVTFGTFAGLIAFALVLDMLKKIIKDPKNKKILQGEA